MASVNKAIIVGSLGRDPEVRYTQSGSAVANISVATTEKRKDANGNKLEETEWHKIVFFGKLAEIVGQYLVKGSSIYVEGKIKTRKWKDKEGNDRYTTEIVAHEMQMLGGGRSQNSGGNYGGAQTQEGAGQGGQGFDPDEEIPF